MKNYNEANSSITPWGILIAVLVMIITLPAAASDTTYQKEMTIHLNSVIRNRGLNHKEKSEKLVDLAEEFIGPVGFMYADEILQVAQKYDPTNKTAELLRIVIKPLLYTRGIYKRVEPLMKKEPIDVQRDYERTVGDLPNSGIREFLTSGTPNITNESDIQTYLDGFLDAQNQVREYLKANKDFNLEMNVVMPVSGFKGSLKDLWKVCTAHRPSPNVYTLSECPFLKVERVKIQWADLETLQHITAGIQMLTIMATAYDMKGVLAYNRAVHKGWRGSDKSIVTYFSRIHDFGQLRSGNALSLVRAMGSDIYAGAKWAHRYQNSLCPRGKGKKNRPGTLFSQGICVNDKDAGMSVKDIFDTLELALRGHGVDIFVSQGETFVSSWEQSSKVGRYNTTVNVFAPFINPVRDLKPLMPTEFSSCGNAQNVGDPTLGGLFPRRDASVYLERVGAIEKGCVR